MSPIAARQRHALAGIIAMRRANRMGVQTGRSSNPLSVCILWMYVTQRGQSAFEADCAASGKPPGDDMVMSDHTGNPDMTHVRCVANFLFHFSVACALFIRSNAISGKGCYN